VLMGETGDVGENKPVGGKEWEEGGRPGVGVNE